MTPEEEAARHLAVAALRDLEEAGFIRPAKTLLEATYRDVQGLVRKGVAVAWLADQLEYRWQAHPDQPLSDLLKTQPRDRVELFARILAEAGLHDLDELLMPDLGPEVLGDDDG